MMYVALSRVTSLSGLNIVNFHSKYIQVSEDVLDDNEDSLTNRKCILNYTLLPSNSSEINVYYENVQSLRAHFNNLKKHNAISNSHIIMLVETRLKNTDLSLNFSIPKYEIIRLDQYCINNQNPSGGVLMYIHESVEVERVVLYQSQGIEMLQLYVSFNFTRERYILLYRHPGTAKQNLIDAMNTLNSTFAQDTITPIFMIGDFNYDILVEENRAIVGKIEEITNLKLQPSSATTKAGTQIDLVFSNQNINTCTHFIPWSMHFGISCTKNNIA